jgi:uncharacterized protein (TIGR02266 family)
VFALKAYAEKSAAVCQDDPRRLAAEEATLLSAEARLEARAAELFKREQASAALLSQQRDELKALSQSRAGGMAVDALSKIPNSAPRAPEPGPERFEALVARRAALEARQRALEAEEQELRQREEALVRLDQGVLTLRQVASAVRQKTHELLEAEKIAAERQREQKARVAARPPTPQAAATLPSSAAKPVASGATATGLEEAAKSDQYARQRRTQRVTLQADVDLFSDSNFYTGFSSDLSDGGIFVATCNMLDEGTEVEIAFTLPGDRRIQARGVVRWHREFNERYPEVFPGMGIEFVEMPDESRQAVHAFTSKREPMFWAS